MRLSVPRSPVQAPGVIALLLLLVLQQSYCIRAECTFTPDSTSRTTADDVISNGNTVTCGPGHDCNRAVVNGCEFVNCLDTFVCSKAQITEVPSGGVVNCGVSYASCWDISIQAASDASIQVNCIGVESCYGSEIDTGISGKVDCIGSHACTGNFLFSDPAEITSQCLDCTSDTNDACEEDCKFIATAGGFPAPCVDEAINGICLGSSPSDPTSSPSDQPQPTRAPAPAPAPTEPPTESPPPSCFSGSMTVHVRGIGKVQMKHLKVGQSVFTGSTNVNMPIYEAIYAFGHHQANLEGYYLRLYAETNDPLELSASHLIFRGRDKYPVRAGFLEVGDVLTRRSIYGNTTVQTTITEIDRVKRTGLYQPLTKGGTIVVNGIQASAYVSIQDKAPNVVNLMMMKDHSIVNEQSLFHWWMSPYRLFCTRIIPQSAVCGSDEEEGVLYWLLLGEYLAKLGNVLPSIIVVCGCGVVLLLCALSMGLESILAIDHTEICIVVTLVVWCALTSNRKSSY